LNWWPKGLAASDKRRHKCAACGRGLTGDDSMSLLPRLKVRSSKKLGWPDPSTMSGGDRKVSIRTTLATSRTRAQDIAGSGACRDATGEASGRQQREKEEESDEC